MDKNLQCPCCGYFTINSEDEIVVDICDVCLWQYDEIAHRNPEISIGPNGISLNVARDNYKQFGVSKKEYFGKNINRKPGNDEINDSR